MKTLQMKRESTALDRASKGPVTNTQPSARHSTCPRRLYVGHENAPFQWDPQSHSQLLLDGSVTVSVLDLLWPENAGSFCSNWRSYPSFFPRYCLCVGIALPVMRGLLWILVQLTYHRLRCIA